VWILERIAPPVKSKKRAVLAASTGGALGGCELVFETFDGEFEFLDSHGETLRDFADVLGHINAILAVEARAEAAFDRILELFAARTAGTDAGFGLGF
jgi:hypothetical protein